MSRSSTLEWRQNTWLTAEVSVQWIYRTRVQKSWYMVWGNDLEQGVLAGKHKYLVSLWRARHCHAYLSYPQWDGAKRVGLLLFSDIQANPTFNERACLKNIKQ